MVVHARLSNSTFTLIFLLAGILILSPANAAPTADSVSFHYQNILFTTVKDGELNGLWTQWYVQDPIYSEKIYRDGESIDEKDY